MLAGTTSRAQINPRVSTATNRLRPTIFFPRVVAFWPALLGRLHRLAVENSRRRLGRFSRLLADLVPHRIVNPVPGAVLLPGPEVVESDPIRWQVMGQGPPSAAVAGLVQDRVHDLAPAIAGWPPAWLRLGHVRFYALPLRIR